MSQTLHKQILIGALDLFTSPKSWIKRCLYNPEKTAFCAIGALEIVARRFGQLPSGEPFKLALCLTTRIAQARGEPTLSAYNDRPLTTFDDIKSLFREAIATVDV